MCTSSTTPTPAPSASTPTARRAAWTTCSTCAFRPASAPPSSLGASRCAARPARENGTVCRWGNRGCLEPVAGPPAIAHLLSQSWHRPVTSQELMQLVHDCDPGACRAVEDAAAHVGLAIAAAVNVLNPRLVVIGGHLSPPREVLLHPIRTAMRRHVLPATAAEVTAVRGELG